MNENYDVKNEYREELKKLYESLQQTENLLVSKDSRNFDELWKHSGLARLMLYFIMNGKFDCDVSKLVMENHRNKRKVLISNARNVEIKLQDKSKYKYKIYVDEKVYLGDTLTSLWNPIKLWIQSVSEDNNTTMLEKIGNRYCIPKTEVARIKKVFKANNKQVWAVYILENLDYFESLFNEDIKKVIDIYHTENNFILVPTYFNRASAGIKAKNDFSDLKLKAICEYFRSGRNTEFLENLFSDFKEKREALDKTIEWLGNYKTWEEFCNDNVSAKYLDYSGEPKELWKNHRFGEIPNKQQLVELFSNLRKILCEE